MRGETECPRCPYAAYQLSCTKEAAMTAAACQPCVKYSYPESSSVIFLCLLLENESVCLILLLREKCVGFPRITRFL